MARPTPTRPGSWVIKHLITQAKHARKGERKVAKGKRQTLNAGKKEGGRQKGK